MKERIFVSESVSGGKFWKCSLNENIVFITFGKIETDGSSMYKEFETTEEAKKFMIKKIQEKIKKGYQEIVE
jgi:predicted DNA-binding WGR domain protein